MEAGRWQPFVALVPGRRKVYTLFKMSVQIPIPPTPQVQPQVSSFTARPVEIREPAARTVTRTAVASSREALENKDDSNNRSEKTADDRQASVREIRSAPRGGRGRNVDIDV